MNRLLQHLLTTLKLVADIKTSTNHFKTGNRKCDWLEASAVLSAVQTSDASYANGCGCTKQGPNENSTLHSVVHAAPVPWPWEGRRFMGKALGWVSGDLG